MKQISGPSIIALNLVKPEESFLARLNISSGASTDCSLDTTRLLTDYGPSRLGPWGLTTTYPEVGPTGYSVMCQLARDLVRSRLTLALPTLLLRKTFGIVLQVARRR